MSVKVYISEVIFENAYAHKPTGEIAYVTSSVRVSCMLYTRRMMLEKQALCEVSGAVIKWNRVTNNTPVPKTAPTVNFLFNGTLNFQTTTRGSIRIEKSETMLQTDVAKMDALVEMQIPGSDGSVSLALGTQARMNAINILK